MTPIFSLSWLIKTAIVLVLFRFPVYAKAIGVDIDELLISQPDTAEQALEIADMLIRSGSIDVIVIDSVAALTPKAEIEGEMGSFLSRPPLRWLRV